MYKCTNVQMYRCTDVQMYRCTNVQMYKCTNVQVYKCTDVQMYRCTNVQMYRCTNVEMYKCRRTMHSLTFGWQGQAGQDQTYTVYTRQCTAGGCTVHTVQTAVYCTHYIT